MAEDLFEASALASAKADVMHEAKKKGCHCPVCGQFVKVYRRTINKSSAVLLARACRKFGEDISFHITDLIEGGGGDFAKLRYWGLIEQIENNNDKKKHSGKWRLTKLGVYFVKHGQTLPKYALIYDGKLLDFDGDELITIQDALGKDFDYQELMAA